MFRQRISKCVMTLVVLCGLGAATGCEDVIPYEIIAPVIDHDFWVVRTDDHPQYPLKNVADPRDSYMDPQG